MKQLNPILETHSPHLAPETFVPPKLEVPLPLQRKLAQVKMLVLDVDGVMTDTRVFLDGEGEWRRLFSVRDGVGIKRISMCGYKTAFITGSSSEDIRERARILQVNYLYEGNLNKAPAFKKLLEESHFPPEGIAYVGDDFFDIPILKQVGFSATVPEAMEEVMDCVDYITRRPGGLGAVREICDLIFKYGAFAPTNHQRETPP